MPIDWSPDAQEFHLRNDRISYVMRVLENGWLGHLYFGLGAEERPVVSPISWPGEFVGFSNRFGEPVPLEYPTGGGGDYRVPALAVEQPDGSGVLDLRYKSHRIMPGQAGHSGSAVDLHRGGRRGRDARDPAPRSRRRSRGPALYTLFRDRPLVARSMRLTNASKAPLIVRCAMSASMDIAGLGLAAHHAERRLGSRAPRRSARPPAGEAVRVEPPGRVELPAQPVRGAGPAVHDRGGRRGDRPVPGLLGQLPGRGGGGAVRDGASTGGHQPRGLLVGARAGRGLRHARGDPGLLRTRASAR